MTHAPTRKSRTPESDRPKFDRSPRARAARLASFERRIRAAGLVRDDDDTPPTDMDLFRNAMARRIAMFINTWRGCPERICRRQRGCMAPNIHCSNAPPLPPRTEEEQREALAKVQRAIRDALAKQEREGR